MSRRHKLFFLDWSFYAHSQQGLAGQLISVQRAGQPSEQLARGAASLTFARRGGQAPEQNYLNLTSHNCTALLISNT